MNKYKIAYIDKNTGAKATEELNANSIDEIKKNYSILGYEIVNHQIIEQNVKTNENIQQASLPPIGTTPVNTPFFPQPQDSLSNSGVKPEWKTFSVKGEKFRINTQTSEIQNLDWVVVEDEKEADKILSEFGVILERDQDSGKVSTIADLMGAKKLVEVMKLDWVGESDE